MANGPLPVPTPLLVADKSRCNTRRKTIWSPRPGRFRFEVHQGDRYVLLGPSGCGKSSLLKSIAGFLPPVVGLVPS